jgi:antitoxin (DNA-binding transcriptional repressor) of toxin-antitoxin stability system
VDIFGVNYARNANEVKATPMGEIEEEAFLADFDALLDAVAAGETIAILQQGQVVAYMTPARDNESSDRSQCR